MEQMATAIGVPYQRIAEWRRRETNIANAKRDVLRAAARYLEVPTAFVLCLAGVITVEDVLAPSEAAAPDQFRRLLRDLRSDPAWAGFLPEALMTADPEVQRFVALLYKELRGKAGSHEIREFEWMRAIHRAALGDAQAQAELEEFRRGRPEG